MTAVSRIYLDTNVFIMAFEGQNSLSGLLLQLFETSKNRSPATRGLTTDAEVLTVLRPDEPTLTSLIKSLSP